MNVRSRSNPHAMMSFALSNAKPLAWASVSGLPSFWNRNFSSSAGGAGEGGGGRRGQRVGGRASASARRGRGRGGGKREGRRADGPVSWTTSGTPNTFWSQHVKTNGTMWPRCIDPDDGPRPVYR